MTQRDDLEERLRLLREALNALTDAGRHLDEARALRPMAALIDLSQQVVEAQKEVLTQLRAETEEPLALAPPKERHAKPT
ncbi:MAG: hypothetical protein HRU11_12555 [Parvularculaceae bacterium]|nr:hypothetical protein [Parvularculaceae bacterium]